MARRPNLKKQPGARYVRDRGLTTAPANVEAGTIAIGSPTTELVIPFPTPMLVDTAAELPAITVGTLSPTSTVASGPAGVTLGYGATLTSGATVSISGQIPNYRTPAGGYLLPTRRTL